LRACAFAGDNRGPRGEIVALNDRIARNKLALLDRTRDQRVAVGERHRKSQLAHAGALAELNAIRGSTAVFAPYDRTT
jgi:hypothetical protein